MAQGKRFTAAAEPSAAIKWADLHGDLLLIEPTGVEEVTTRYGTSEAVNAAVYVIEGQNTGDEYPDGKVFPTVLCMQLRQSIGGIVVGRLKQGTASGSQSAPWRLSTELTDEDAATAEAWLDRRDGNGDDEADTAVTRLRSKRPDPDDTPF